MAWSRCSWGLPSMGSRLGARRQRGGGVRRSIAPELELFDEAVNGDPGDVQFPGHHGNVVRVLLQHAADDVFLDGGAGTMQRDGRLVVDDMLQPEVRRGD